VGCLKDPGRSEAQKFTYLGVIERKIGVLVNLVDSLLDSFFLRSDQVQVLRQQADVNEILTQCVSDFQMQATERDQQLVVEPFPGGGTLWCDAGKVSQVLENLLGNAIKYTRKSDIITITASETQDRAVQFSVRDNGPGIPKEEQEKIFEPFHRMESTSRAVAGYGLGLAICKQFVRAHGGNLWVESTPGAGATFCFVIPRSGGPPPA
ncbi:MAG: HAMP domain-containing histidine kinase, partial [Candidatus Wallbacteria bacterium]|nr:HAMP domain-containing histidine kinase [Candidatus Wallbacteria bacterium]